MVPNVQTLVQEALSVYEANAKLEAWAYAISDAFRNNGWFVNHPGSDKWVARQGNVIVKWIGHCEWSANAIHDELYIHEVFRKRGFAKYLPKLYATRDDRFIVEQYVNGGRVADNVCGEIEYELRKVGIHTTDLCGRNVIAFMGIPKVVDGRIDDVDEDSTETNKEKQ